MIIGLRLFSLLGFVLYSLYSSQNSSLLLNCLWLLTVIASVFLANHLNRNLTIWGAVSLCFPFWGAALLSLLSKRPEKVLTAVDNSWLNMERPTNKMVVTGIMFFKSPVDPQALFKTVEQGLLKFERFKQKVVNINHFNSWENDPQFVLSNHIHFHAADEIIDPQGFHKAVDHLTEQPLDFTKPLWQMDLYQGVNGGSALVVRIHHCIADGIALIRVLLSMTTTELPQEAPSQKPFSQTKDSPIRQLLQLVVGLLAAVPHALKLPDSDSPLKNPLSGKRKTAWSEPLKLEKIRQLSKENNAKINDVVLAATAGALRTYLSEQGTDPDCMTLRVLVPINLKPMEGEIVLGNQVGFVYLPLPISENNPTARINAVKQSMNQIKGGQEAMLSLLSLKLIGSLPRFLQTMIIDTFNKNASSTMTNVPGPKTPLLFAGQKVENMMFFGPQSGTMGVGISVLSYAGTMTMAINSDANLIPNPNRVTDLFTMEIEKWPIKQ
ncbi:MAG: WS/DGAT domain-containing protein [Pseudomonadales bacterium]|nr:WS/DGAT domain-containing protein [Pseudomonadales bacterium]